MNSFELRQSKRRAKLAKQREDRAFAATLEAVGVQSFFEEAFVQRYQRVPKLTYRKGWFFLQGKRYSKEQIKQCAMQLYATAEEKDNEL